MGAVLQLRELFPLHSTPQLHAALAECEGQLDGAMEVLLQQEPAVQQPQAACLGGKVSWSHPPTRPASAQQQHKVHKPRAAKTSWSALRDAQAPAAGSGSRSAPPSPLYVRPGGRHAPSPPSLSDQVFPSLGVISPALVNQQRVSAPAAEPAGDVDCPEAGSAAPHTQQAAVQSKSQQQQQLQPRRSVSAQSFAELVKQQPAQYAKQAVTWQSPAAATQQPPAPHGSVAGIQQQRYVGEAQQQQQQQPGFNQLKQQLAELHLQYDEHIGQQGLLHNESGNAAAATVALLEPESDAIMGAFSPEQLSQGHQQQQQQQQQATSDQGGNQPKGQHAAVRQQQQHQQQQQQHGYDVYHTQRREAIKLTNKWQKVLKRSAAAAAAGDHSAAKQLAAEARALKAAADEAHAAAAVRIEVANNINSNAGLWELDLHGLHAKEALLALQERLELLQFLVQDILSQAQPAHTYTTSTAGHMPGLTLDKVTGPTDAQQHVFAPHHSIKDPVLSTAGSRQQLLAQLLLVDDAQSVPLHVRQAAARQELRVIVGKGNNSSGGEASLPRVVEQWLGEHKYRYVPRTGAIDVKLKRVMGLGV